MSLPAPPAIPPPALAGSAATGRAGTLSAGFDALRLAAVGFAARFAARLAGRFRAVAVLRALVFRAAPARERAVRFVFRAALVFRPRDALRLRLALVFFLPRGGICLLRELGSQSSGGRSKFAAR